MPAQNRAKKGEYVNRISQAVLDEVSLLIQEQRELIDHLKTVNKALYEALAEIRQGCSGGSRIGNICDTALALVEGTTTMKEINLCSPDKCSGCKNCKAHCGCKAAKNSSNAAGQNPASRAGDVPRCEECGAELQSPARFCGECSAARFQPLTR